MNAQTERNGRAWRVYLLNATHGGHDTAPAAAGFAGYIGWTAEEAFRTLHAIAGAWDAVTR